MNVHFEAIFGVIIRHNKKHCFKFRREERLGKFYFKPSLNFGPQKNLVLSSNQRQGKIVELLGKVQIVFMVFLLTKMLIKRSILFPEKFLLVSSVYQRGKN